MRISAISKFEWLILAVTFAMLAIGVISSFTNKIWFTEVYAVEDGIAEWVTLLPLFASLVIILVRLLKQWQQVSVMHKLVQLFLAFFCFFVIGEEVSWGMRLFNLELTEFFSKYNNQSETNFHNLEIDGFSINKIIFSRLIILVAFIYLVIFPILYRKWSWLHRLADNWGVPVPRIYQILGFFLVFGFIGLIGSGKRAEILELGACFMFLLVIYNPVNLSVFTPMPANKAE